MEQRLWYHGTSRENADKILVEGFREGTYFAQNVDDALCMGGAYVFAVSFSSSQTSSCWQWGTPSAIPSERIHSLRRFEVELLQFNPDEARKLEHASFIHWYKEVAGRDVQTCSTCDGDGEMGIVHDGRGLLPCGSPEAAQEDDTIVCPDCRGHGVIDK